ncbi:MAG: SLBB domain-containing protein [Firmicutes bacterium]|nr:SLBB domain-containing protein [Bacillota bacterium]
MAQMVEVRPDGKISFPLIDDLMVDNLTIPQVKEALTKQLAQYVRDPKVTVAVKKFRTITVQVSGEVRNPGLYLLQPDSSISDAIAAAGGLTPDADGTRIKFVPKSGGVSLVNLDSVADTLGEKRLQNGDQIIVPEVPKVMVMGEVRSPGMYPLKPGSRVSDAIATAGGLTGNGDVTSVRVVFSQGGTGSFNLRDFFLNGDQTNNPIIRNGDQIIVPALPTVTVLGEVNRPGLVQVEAGSTISDILAQLGGTTPDANLQRVELTIYQTAEAAPITQVFDLTKADGNRPISVPRSASVVITVPKIQWQVTVLGEVQRPGTYPVSESSRLLEVIGKAGGPTDRARLDGVRVYRGGDFADPESVVVGREHLLFEGDSKENPQVKPGDVIFVPETKRIDWDKVIKLLTGLKLTKDLLE